MKGTPRHNARPLFPRKMHVCYFVFCKAKYCVTEGIFLDVQYPRIQQNKGGYTLEHIMHVAEFDESRVTHALRPKLLWKKGGPVRPCTPPVSPFKLARQGCISHMNLRLPEPQVMPPLNRGVTRISGQPLASCSCRSTDG